MHVESDGSVASLHSDACLAKDGGRPVRQQPFPKWPIFVDDDICAVTSVLRSGAVNYWTGEEGRIFEREYARFVGTNFAIALANGSVALELALYALGVGSGDEVVVTSRSFIASASCVAIRGAIPVFADVDINSQNLTSATILPLLTSRTKAIVVVHLAGWPCDMDPIMALADDHNLGIIEDCAQAHGATYKGRQVGSIGHINAFSFCQDKILSTGGEGGLLTTNNEELWHKAWSYKDHGKDYNSVYHKHHPPGYRFHHDSIGTNWRLTEMQAALGRRLLRKLPEHVVRRRTNAAFLTARLSQIPGLRVPIPPPEISHAYYRYYLFVRPDRLRRGWDRDRIMEAICAEGIPCAAGYRELYLEKALSAAWRPREPKPVAQQLSETSLFLLVHSNLSDADMLDTCLAVEKVMKAAGL